MASVVAQSTYEFSLLELGRDCCGLQRVGLQVVNSQAVDLQVVDFQLVGFQVVDLQLQIWPLAFDQAVGPQQVVFLF